MTVKSGPAAPASAPTDLERRLRDLRPAPGPDARFRADLRAQLLAAHQRGSVAEVAAPAPPRPRLAPAGFTGQLVLPGRRALAVLAAAAAVLLVVTGTTYWLSQRALPGDALYGLKRAGETVDLSIKGGDVNRGSAYLSLSSTRIDEAAQLVRQNSSAAEPGSELERTGYSAAGPLSAHVDELVHGVLSDGDSAAVTATRLLTTASVASRAMKPASTVSSWLADQRGKVGDLVARLPEAAPPTAGGAARALQRDLVAITARVAAITLGVRCGTCRFTESDRLGPVPCRTCPRSIPAPMPMTPDPSATRRHQPPSTVTRQSGTAAATAAPSLPGSAFASKPGSGPSSGATASRGAPRTSAPATAQSPDQSPDRAPTQAPVTAPTAPADPGTVPATSAPPTTAPPSTVPPATAPPSTVPPATAPPTTVPPTTAAPSTVPPATVPPATAPPATAAPATPPPATDAQQPTVPSLVPICLPVGCGNNDSATDSAGAATP